MYYILYHDTHTLAVEYYSLELFISCLRYGNGLSNSQHGNVVNVWLVYLSEVLVYYNCWLSYNHSTY